MGFEVDIEKNTMTIRDLRILAENAPAKRWWGKEPWVRTPENSTVKQRGPCSVGLLTKVSAPDRVKAVAGIVLSAVAALITQATTADGGAVLSQDMIVTWALALGTSIASYLGVWKPVGSSDQVPLQNATANFGIG